MRAALRAAPGPPGLRAVVHEILNDSGRILGGRLTPWASLPVYCALAMGGTISAALPASVACELYAAALDVIDDIQDDDPAPVITLFGMPVALNGALALLALADIALYPARPRGADTPRHARARSALWAGLMAATGGQHLDIVSTGSTSLSIGERLAMARGKSGALVEACARAGASLSTDDDAQIARCGLLGRGLGLCGQIENDIHDAANPGKKGNCPTQTLARHAGDVPLAYALLYAEWARVRTAADDVIAHASDATIARAALAPLFVREDGKDGI